MKTFLVFAPGQDPLEVDELPTPLPDKAWIYERDTNKWYYPSQAFNLAIPEHMVPKQYRMWRLIS